MRSEKFKKRLIPIKKDLMKEIASLLVNGRFDMAKETLIYYDDDSIASHIPIWFNYLEGDENKIKLRKLDMPFACQISFSVDSNITIGTVAGEVMFLSRLLDYMELDRKGII